MVKVYSDADYLSALKQKKRIWTIFWSVTIFYALFCIAWLLYYTTLPVHPEADRVLPQAMVYVASAIYIIFICPFAGIKLARVRKYCKMMSFISLGKKNVEESYFMGFYKKRLQKDSVDVISCIFRVWNKRRKDWSEREAYIDNEQDWPELERGDYVRFVTQSNFVIEYEVLREGAMQEDIAKGYLPQDMLEEDRPVFGKIYNVIDPDAPPKKKESEGEKEEIQTEETQVSEGEE